MIYKVFRILLYPLLRFVIPLFSKSAKSRLKFELDHVNNSKVDIIFHISSEGELEQCFPLLMDYLKEFKVLLLFTSQSVLKKALELKGKEENLYLESKRVLSYFPFFNKGIYKYQNIKKFFMVRYDFFPELIDFSYKHESILLNASLINKNKTKGLAKYMLRKSLLSFDKIIYASESEIDRFKDFGITTPYYALDLRALRILDRKKVSKNTLSESLRSFFNYRNYNFNKIVVLGSYWDSELIHLKQAIKSSISSQNLIFIAPHSLRACEHIAEKLKKSDIESIIVDPSTDLSSVYEQSSVSNRAIILNVPGILCELYSVCDHAYIAGGWHKSIHSVLEPFVMKSDSFISCGPNISRSTEFELAAYIDEKRISSLNTIDQFEFLREDYKGQTYNVSNKYLELKDFIS